jgi:hypothetical protein
MTSALSQGRVLSDTDPVHMAEMYTARRRAADLPPGHTGIMPVGAVYDRIERLASEDSVSRRPSRVPAPIPW